MSFFRQKSNLNPVCCAVLWQELILYLLPFVNNRRICFSGISVVTLSVPRRNPHFFFSKFPHIFGGKISVFTSSIATKTRAEKNWKSKLKFVWWNKRIFCSCLWLPTGFPEGPLWLVVRRAVIVSWPFIPRRGGVNTEPEKGVITKCVSLTKATLFLPWSRAVSEYLHEQHLNGL